MCFTPSSRPPVDPALLPRPLIEGAVVRDFDLVRTVRSSHGRSPSSVAAVVLPDGRGLHPYYESLVQRFAEVGIDAVGLDIYPVGTNDPMQAEGTRPRFTWDEVRGNIGDVVKGFRRDRADRRVFVIGFCLGGRLAMLSASEKDLSLSGVIALYGAPSGASRHDLPAPLDRAAGVRVPLLGVFGGADELVPVESIAAYELALISHRVDHEIVVYPGAPHSFFDRRFAEFAAENKDVWRRVLGFVR